MKLRVNKKAKFKKSRKDKIVAGVLGGVGEYLGIDSTLVRIVWLIALALTGFVPGVGLYILAAILVPAAHN